MVLSVFRVVERESTRAPAITDQLVLEATTWLAQHLDCRRPLEEVSAAIGCAGRTLAQHFHRHGGLGVKATLDRLRMQQAQHLLADSDLLVGEIGRRCGYASSTAFGIAFKRIHGTSPGSWRRALGGDRCGDL